ncbi:unnamed protein product [Closterium sp. NIES-54]
MYGSSSRPFTVEELLDRIRRAAGDRCGVAVDQRARQLQLTGLGDGWAVDQEGQFDQEVDGAVRRPDNKGEVRDVFIPWICAFRLQLRERFREDLPVLRLHSKRGGEFSSDLLRDFCRGEGILQSFTLPASPQQNRVAECHIGLVMEVARTSMIHVAAPHFLWPFAVRYAAHQLNLWPRVSLPETSPTLRWTGKVGDVSVFRVWGSCAFVRDPSADKLSSRAILCGPAPSRVSQVDPLPGTVPVEVAVDSGSARVAASWGAASRGDASGGAEPASAEPGGAEPEGVEPGGTESEGAEPGGAESEGAESGGAEPRGTPSAGGPAARGSGGARAAGPGGARSRGTGAARASGVGGAGAGDPEDGDLGAGGTGAGARGARAGDPGARGAGAGGTDAGGAGAGGTGAGDSGAGDTGAGGAGAGGAGAGDHGAGGTGAGGAGAGGARAGGTGAGDPRSGGAGTGGAGAGGTGAGGTVQRRPFFIPPPPSSLPPPDLVLRQFLSLPYSTSLPPSLLSPPPHQSQPKLQPDSPLPAPSPYAEQTDSFTEHREAASRPASPVRTSRRVPRPRPPPILSTHIMALRPSSVPLRVPLPPPLASSLPAIHDPESDLARAASPTVPRLLATVDTDPSFESIAASALVAELLEFATVCHLDYATSLVAESESECPPSVGGECALGTDVLEDRQEDFECLASVVPHLVAMLLAPEGDPDAPDIPTPRSYVEAITCHYSSQWQTAMDAEMASWKSTGTDVDAVLQRFGFRYSSPQSTPLPTGHSLSAPPLDESVEPSGPYPELVGCLMYLMTCTRLDLAYPLSILARHVALGRHRPEH